MTREHDPFQIPRAGLEAAPLAGLASLRIGGRSAPLPTRQLVTEATLASMVVYGVYQALLSGLRSEGLVRRGVLTRPAQARLILATVWEAMKEGTAVGLVLSLVVLVCPWLAMPLTILGAVGLGKASVDLFHAFWDGLSASQRQQLHAAAYDAGVNLNRLLGGTRTNSLDLPD
ncbi:MAG: hypothetical protein VKP70_07160 [Cyanobacteriota bacterium]|nr:hypothetical protein [Cyanobacteriota bacterium]